MKERKPQIFSIDQETSVAKQDETASHREVSHCRLKRRGMGVACLLVCSLQTDVELNNLLSKWGNEKRQFDELDVYHHWRAPITCHYGMLVSDH